MARRVESGVYEGYRPPAPEAIQSTSYAPFIPPLGSVPLNGEYSRPLTEEVVQKVGVGHLPTLVLNENLIYLKRYTSDLKILMTYFLLTMQT